MKYTEAYFSIDSINSMPEGYLSAYYFDIEIFNAELYRKLAIDYTEKNLFKVVPRINLTRLFGEFDYIDNHYIFGMRGYIALKKVNSVDYFEKCKLLEREILLGMNRLGYYNDVDFEISIIEYCQKDVINKKVSRHTYIAADTTYSLDHPQFAQLKKLEYKNILFKYSKQGLYENNVEDALKIVELLNSGDLKINYVNNDLLPVLKEIEPPVRECSKIEKNGSTVYFYNDSNIELVETIIKSL